MTQASPDNSLPHIVAHRTQRAGITVNFRGFAPDESGEPAGELVDVDLVVPPLSFDSIQRMQGRYEKLLKAGGLDSDSVDTLVEALELAILRNYRGVPTWLIRQTIDPANMTDIVMALMDVGGARRKEIDAAEASRTDS